ncbi:histidine triad nucleotide-binding protein [Blastopirellula sp. JC732]|uniref:Histidine triad nucleotide-binding protein n=1 Tax=Blastopirellula sediminis TaxID=2894196 RepID=A0A9X1MRY1_9BACT|nr:histidine triad nucleotide-binding protein [Blastopirellula sediminis]MCC9605365.1 histidine triad nucleotide-binding protein [Blastopirellula sediminis]MCC9631335.1 histidine triad nucleotide-binding protein [Blastopirellula sediminis]
MNGKTIFKKIIDGEIPADVIYEDEHCLVFRDIAPKAPTHVLVIPKKEIATLDDIADEDAAVMGHLWLVVRDVARQLGLENGYRVVVNCKEEGGQEVPHVHLHLMGGRKLTWPPG